MTRFSPGEVAIAAGIAGGAFCLAWIGYVLFIW